MFKIHGVQTGRVKVKAVQRRREGKGGLGQVLLSRRWSDWLPIYAWVIEHPEGLIVVDTGETARTGDWGYFPLWQPYYWLAVRMDVSPEEEIGPQMRALGLDPDGVDTVVLTHLHTDHAGGLGYFPNSKIYVSGEELKGAQGFSGKVQGYLPHRWPARFAPRVINFEERAYGPFERSFALTKAGDVVVVPTPGHTAGHVSVIVKTAGLSYFLAGDTSYSQEILLERVPDGVSPDVAAAKETMDRILQLAAAEAVVYLPAHDDGSAGRLETGQRLVVGE